MNVRVLGISAGCIAATLLGFSSWASAATISFQETFDDPKTYNSHTTLLRDSVTAGNSDSTSTQVGTTGTSKLRVLTSFDLSAIPAGSTISSVTLTMSRRQIDATSTDADFNINLHQVTAPFLETEANWNERMTGINWATPGGDVGALLGTITANPTTWVAPASENPFPNPATEKAVFDSSAAFVAAAQGALDNVGNQTLYLMLKLDAAGEASSTRVLFPFAYDVIIDAPGQPNRSTTADMAPLLTVNYVPEPQSIVLMTFGVVGAALLIKKRRK